MSGYLGSWKIDDLLTFTVVTHVVTTGVATDADAVPAYRVYEDETTTPILTGTMALLDSANTAGLYSEQITLSAANGFEKGKSYNIHIAATVNGVAVATVRSLQIEAEVDANTISGALTTYTGNTPQTGDSYAIVNSGTHGNAAIKGYVDDIGVAGAGLTDLGGMSTTMKAQVQTEAEDALVTHRVDELLNADSDIDGAAPPTVGSVFHELMTKTTGSFTYDQTTDALEALRDNTGTAGAGLTNIDLPNQTMDITGNITGNVSGSVGSVTGLTTATIAAAVWASVIETGFTALQSLRLVLSAAAAKLSGAATTTVVIRDVNDSKDRITATVDGDGNRTAITTDVS